MSSPRGAWYSKFPVYQVDFTAAASGKRVASTKRKIRWRFGFPNKEALDQGLTGPDCRGEEHDVTIIWSITSGKRQISFDGHEIHYSSSRAGILDHSWATRTNHVIKVIAHASPPLSATPGFRQYDLLINGQSFFNMPKMYELGIKGPVPSLSRAPGVNDYGPISSRSPGGGGGNRMYDLNRGEYVSGPSSREQEEEDLRKAIEASLEESRRHLEKKREPDDVASLPSPAFGGGGGTTGNADLLLDFGASPERQVSDAQTVSSYYTAPPTYNTGANPTSPSYNGVQNGTSPHHGMYAQSSDVGGGQLVPAQAPPNYYAAPPGPPPPPNNYAAPPPNNYAAPPPTNYSALPVPAATTPVYQTAPSNFGSPPPVPAPAPTPEYRAPPPAHQATPEFLNYAPAPGHDVFGLSSPPEDDPFAPKPPPPPTHNDIASAILGAYGSKSAPQTPVGVPTPSGFGGSPDSAPVGQQRSTPQGNSGQPNVGSLTMNQLTITDDEPPQNPVDAAMRKLVNVDRIDEPAEGEIKLTMMKKEEKDKKSRNGKSRGLPPAATGLVGSGATLGQIQQVKPTTPKAAPESIMKPPPTLFAPGAVNAGALVVHGQGPPPLQQPRGFGAGALLPNGGFSNVSPQGNYQGYPPHQHGYQQQQQYR